MKSNYRRLGDYIREVKVRNTEQKAEQLLGINIDKFFMPSVANVIGTDLSVYKIVKKNQFACNRMHVGRDYRLPVSLSKTDEEFMVSPAYDVFEIKDTEVLYPEYLMMWFTRREFDRNAWFYTDADVRGGLHWKAFCDMQLPIPTITKQKEIVKEYNVIQNRIALNQQLIQKLEETAQAIYKQWFVEFEFPDEHGKPYKSSGGEMVFNEELEKEIPKDWEYISLSNYVKVNSGYAFKSEWWSSHGGPVIKIGSIKNNTISESDLEFIFENKQFNKNDYSVNKGDIVIAMTGFTMGKVGLIPDFHPEFYINQRVGFFKLGHSDYHQSGFLFCTLLTEYVQNEIWSVGGDSQQFNVSNDDIEAIKILIPRSNIVVERFNVLVKSLFERIILTQSSNRALIKLKDLLLSKLATIEN